MQKRSRTAELKCIIYAFILTINYTIKYKYRILKILRTESLAKK